MLALVGTSGRSHPLVRAPNLVTFMFQTRPWRRSFVKSNAKRREHFSGIPKLNSLITLNVKNKPLAELSTASASNAARAGLLFMPFTAWNPLCRSSNPPCLAIRSWMRWAGR